MARGKNLENVSQKLDKIPLNYDRFPSMKDIDKIFPPFKEYVPPEDTEMWVSKRAPGTPACFEALFKKIESGDTETKAFKWGIRYCKVSEDTLFEAYGKWCEGELHECYERAIKGFAL